MQTEQTEHLRQLIEASAILTPAEKADWLDMLILMNDKQALELENILKGRRPAPQTPAPAPVATRPPAMAQSTATLPPLSHISNLPSTLNSGPAFSGRPSRVTPVPLSSNSTPTQRSSPSRLPWKNQFQATMTEKELPPAPGIRPTIPKTEPVTRPPATAVFRSPVPTPQPQRRSLPQAPVLESLADAGKLTLNGMRGMALEDLVIRLQQLSKIDGYFNLLSYLEDSPLYKSYIDTGKKVLAEQISFNQVTGDDPMIMTKQEFENFADILKKIQIN